MRQRGDGIVPESRDTVSSRRASVLMRFLRMFQSLPGVLVSGRMILLLPVMLRRPVCVRGGIV